jgi:hypothetical protein
MLPAWIDLRWCDVVATLLGALTWRLVLLPPHISLHLKVIYPYSPSFHPPLTPITQETCFFLASYWMRLWDWQVAELPSQMARTSDRYPQSQLRRIFYTCYCYGFKKLTRINIVYGEMLVAWRQKGPLPRLETFPPRDVISSTLVWQPLLIHHR